MHEILQDHARFLQEVKHYYARFSARFSVKIVQDLVSCMSIVTCNFHFERFCKFLQEYVPHHARILQENGHITCKCKIYARFLQEIWNLALNFVQDSCKFLHILAGQFYLGKQLTILSASVAGRVYPNQQFVGTIGAIGRDSGQGC